MSPTTKVTTSVQPYTTRKASHSIALPKTEQVSPSSSSISGMWRAPRATSAVQSASTKRDSAIEAELGDLPEMTMHVERLAAVFAEGGQQERAARLFGATEALGHTLDTPVMGPERVKHNAAIAMVRTPLHDAPFAQAWQTGMSYSWEQLLADALAQIGDDFKGESRCCQPASWGCM